jgi:HAMP domain-containing protein
MTAIQERTGQPSDNRLQQLLTGLTAVRSGDFSTRLPAAEDPLVDEIAAVFNGMNEQLALVTSEVTRVAREVGTEGRLGGQAEVPGLAGSWTDLTDSVNSMAGNLTGQVRDVARVATAVAKGDLGQKITVDVKGEMLELKNTLNTMVDELSAFADEVTRVAREVDRQRPGRGGHARAVHPGPLPGAGDPGHGRRDHRTRPRDRAGRGDQRRSGPARGLGPWPARAGPGPGQPAAAGLRRPPARAPPLGAR